MPLAPGFDGHGPTQTIGAMGGLVSNESGGEWCEETSPGARHGMMGAAGFEPATSRV